MFNHKEYKASKGKVLLNLENFTWGSCILCNLQNSLNLIEVTREEAEEYYGKYQEKLEEAMKMPPYESSDNSSAEDTQILNTQSLNKVKLKGTTTKLNAAGIYEEVSAEIDPIEESMSTVRTSFIEELIAKGYDVSNMVNPIEYYEENTEHNVQEDTAEK